MLNLSACGSTGVKINKDQVTHYKVGVTSYDQVLSELGQPTSRTVDSQGDIHLFYRKSFYTMKPETFLPVVGGHVGGMNSANETFVISFTPEGIMKSSSFSTLKTDAAGAQ
ncbi:MAG: hypothetical protein AAF988_08525 [Pseudomonadota bacterium]